MKYAPAGSNAVKGNKFQIPFERNACDHKSENLDLEWKISSPINLFSKRIQPADQKFEFEFAKENAIIFCRVKNPFFDM